MAVDGWGGAAPPAALTEVTVRDAIPPEKVLWEGVAVPLADVRQTAAIEEVKRLEPELREAELREAELRQKFLAQAGAALTRMSPERQGGTIFEAIQKQLQRREDLERRLGEARQVAALPRTVSATTIPLLPIITIGWPDVWPLPERYPLERMLPPMHAQLQTADFYVIHLACSFRPLPGRARVGWARFHVFLLPDSQGRQPLAYDISPVDISQEVKRQVKVTLAPTLKFHMVDAKVASLEGTWEYPELQPIIVGAGIGEATPTWDYRVATGVAGIQGAKRMDLLVKAPKGMPAATAQLALTGQVYAEDKWIPFAGGPVEQGTRLDVPLWSAPSTP
jgi:hypothetical protein